jgi:hypothetical protein
MSSQSVNFLLRAFGQEGELMVIYPVPIAVTQARIQLVVDQTAKAPPPTIDQDVLAIENAKAQSEHDSLVDFEA